MSGNTLYHVSLNAFSNRVSPSEQTSQDALESPSLEEIVLDQAREISALKSIVEALQKDMDILADNQLIQLRLINRLRKKEPGKMVISRAEKIEKYLQSRPDHKATFETLKGHLGINKQRLNETIKTLMDSAPGKYGIVKTPGVKKGKTLKMLTR